jgi:hypothetical protein
MRIYPEEALIKHDEACNVHHPIQIEVLQLHNSLVQLTEQERVRRVPEAALVECEKAHDLAGIRMRLLVLHQGSPPVHHRLRWQQSFRREMLQL